MWPRARTNNMMRPTRRIAWSPMSWSGAGIRPCSEFESLRPESSSRPKAKVCTRCPSPSNSSRLPHLEVLWQQPEADALLKKRIVRTLIHEVVGDIDASAGEVDLV